MTLLEQCQIWNEHDEYQRIIEAIEAIPAGDRTPELDSELARAYNNLAEVTDQELFEKAVGLLLPHKEYFNGDHSWNFRLAYAYFYLGREGEAKSYFEKALEARPGDEDTKEFLDACRRSLSLPRFEKNFRERTLEAWAAFEKAEAGLRSMMDREDRDSVAEELIGTCSEILETAFGAVSFELGYNGEKYELILTPEGDKAQLFQMVYFERHAPAAVLERWNIWVGRQPSIGFSLRSDGNEVSGSDVLVWVEKQANNRVSLTLYCEKLIPLLQENENRAWWLLCTLTDQILGEIPSMSCIDAFDVTDTPREEPSILMTELPRALEGMGLSLNLDAQEYLDNSYSGYEMKPVEDPDADWRLDVYIATTRLEALIGEYLRGDSDVMDVLHRDGAVGGFLGYPLDGFTGEKRAADILDFRDALQAAITEQAGEDAVTFLGGATGLYCGYLDFIAWDLRPVLGAAKGFFEKSSLKWAAFQTFRRDADLVFLLDREQ